MTETHPSSEARAHLDLLVGHIVEARELVTIMADGHPAAAHFTPERMAELEEALALAEHHVRKANGTTGVGVPMSEVRARLGLGLA